MLMLCKDSKNNGDVLRHRGCEEKSERRERIKNTLKRTQKSSGVSFGHSAADRRQMLSISY